MEIEFSQTAEQHGYGTDRYKWVSRATPEERKIAREDGLVFFDNGVLSGGTHGTTLRKMVYMDGRYRPRVPEEKYWKVYKSLSIPEFLSYVRLSSL